MTPSIKTLYSRFLDLYCIAQGGDKNDPAEGGETNEEILKAVSKIVDDLGTIPEFAEMDLMRRSRLYKFSKKTLGEMASRFDYIEATYGESEALDGLRKAVIDCEQIRADKIK